MDNDPVAFYKALGDSTRLKSILLLVSQQQLCVCELMQALNLSQPKISRHLAILKQQKILESYRQGQWVYYHIHPELPAWQQQHLQQCLSQNQHIISPHLVLLEQMGQRPIRQQAQCC